jgi:uncharacterized protein with NRDE domain
MCLILFAYNIHPSYRLILAANRDEFYDRPSQAADFWPKHPDVLAGIDLKEKGTWLGITKQGKIAAITNYRDPAAWKDEAPSRGKLVRDYLTGVSNPEQYLKNISTGSAAYNGFNLLLGDEDSLWVYSNRGDVQHLQPGIYGLSNHLLNSPWPKVQRGKRLLKKALVQKGDDLEKALFALLADRQVPPDDHLPQTGVSQDWERMLSPVFITSPVYGTRSSTVVLLAKNRRVRFVEQVFDKTSEAWMTGRFSFVQEKKRINGA